MAKRWYNGWWVDHTEFAQIKRAEAKKKLKSGCLWTVIAIVVFTLAICSKDEGKDDGISEGVNPSTVIKNPNDDAISLLEEPSQTNGTANAPQVQEVSAEKIGTLINIIEGTWKPVSSAFQSQLKPIKSLPSEVTILDGGELHLDFYGKPSVRIQKNDILFFDWGHQSSPQDFQPFGILLPDDTTLIWNNFSTLGIQKFKGGPVHPFARAADIELFFSIE